MVQQKEGKKKKFLCAPKPFNKQNLKIESDEISLDGNEGLELPQL